MKERKDQFTKRNWAQVLVIFCALVIATTVGKGCSDQKPNFVPPLDRVTFPRTQRDQERLRYHAAMCQIQAYFLEKLPTKEKLSQAIMHNHYHADPQVNEIESLKMDVACLDLAERIGLPARSTEAFYNQEAALEEAKMTLYTFAEQIEGLTDREASAQMHKYRQVALRGMRLALEYNQKVLSDRQRER